MYELIVSIHIAVFHLQIDLNLLMCKFIMAFSLKMSTKGGHMEDLFNSIFVFLQISLPASR